MSGAIAAAARPTIVVPATEIDLLHRLVRDRPALQTSFAQTWPRLSASGGVTIEDWASATLELSHVNAGPACIAAFWRAGAAMAGQDGRTVLAGGRAAAEICRLAGARAALACLEALPTAIRLTAVQADAAGLAGWWRGLIRLAREAPGLVRLTVERVEILLRDGDGLAFLDFVAAGLKATAKDRVRRAAFFALDHPLAQAMLLRRAGVAGFAESERMLTAFVAGLWGGEPRLAAGPLDGGGMTRRTMIAAGTALLPPVFAGVPAAQIRSLYRASAAHAQAHLTVPSVQHPLLQLKPLQMALVGLIEDSRVEALAIRRFPGLRRLWAGFHVAEPRGVRTAETLMARLARGLLDPDYVDGDGFVSKGRALFAAAAAEGLEDASLSRRIGTLLGNDLGQMRVQFNVRTYAVEPAYRDDNTHLWALPEASDDAVSIAVEAARASGEGGGEQEPGDGDTAPRARSAGLDDRGTLLATYPEWDAVAGVERPDWTSLRDTMPVLREPTPATDGETLLRAQVARLVRSSVIGLSVRQSRQEAGEELDLDAALRAAIARRGGVQPDERVYRDRRPKGRDLSTLVILDVSQSTSTIGPGGQSVLDAQRLAVGALAAALDAHGDRFALRAFASSGRDDVRLIRLKDFDEPMSATVSSRIAGLTSGLSTRLGAALRHAGSELARLRTTRKMVLVLTDGEPSDIDVPHPLELVEDARRAVLGLRLRGIDVFGIVMDPQQAGSAAAIFGRHNSMPVRRLEELPARLAGVYFRMAQR